MARQSNHIGRLRVGLPRLVSRKQVPFVPLNRALRESPI